MCALAHYLEAQGIATVLIGLVPQHVQRMKPPRALLVPFELGRPFGEPSDAQFQRDVLQAALGLLQEPTGPAIHYYDKDAPSSVPVEGFSCPVNFAEPTAETTGLETLLMEVRLLMPWFDRALARRGQTMTGTSGMEIEAICELVWQLINTATPASEQDAQETSDTEATGVADKTPFGDRVKLAIEDLKAFYIEAVMEQPKPGSATQIQQWFWEETSAGQLIFALRKACWDHANSALKLHARFTLVPAARAREWDAQQTGES